MGDKMIIKHPITGENLTLHEDDYNKYLKHKREKEDQINPLKIPYNKKTTK